jgi:hypothetical protein
MHPLLVVSILRSFFMSPLVLLVSFSIHQQTILARGVLQARSRIRRSRIAFLVAMVSIPMRALCSPAHSVRLAQPPRFRILRVCRALLVNIQMLPLRLLARPAPPVVSLCQMVQDAHFVHLANTSTRLQAGCALIVQPDNSLRWAFLGALVAQSASTLI